MDQGIEKHYQPPVVTDYGLLEEITAATHLLLGQVGDSAHDLSFSSGVSPGSATGGTGVTGTGSGSFSSPGALSGVSPTSASGAAGAGPGGGGGAAGGAGDAGAAGELPFTGFVVGAAAAAGSGLIALGRALRRAATRGA